MTNIGTWDRGASCQLTLALRIRHRSHACEVLFPRVTFACRFIRDEALGLMGVGITGALLLMGFGVHVLPLGSERRVVFLGGWPTFSLRSNISSAVDHGLTEVLVRSVPSTMLLKHSGVIDGSSSMGLLLLPLGVTVPVLLTGMKGTWVGTAVEKPFRPNVAGAVVGPADIMPSSGKKSGDGCAKVGNDSAAQG